jgi:hypothetical protein
MAATSSGGGADKVELHDGFIPAVAGTVGEHAETAASSVGAIAPAIPDGVDPLSAAIAMRMSGWGGEHLLNMGKLGADSTHLGAAAGTTAAGLTAADVDNGATISATENT